MKILIVAAGLFLLAGKISAQCPTGLPWELISERCMMCGLVKKSFEDASTYCEEHGGTVGPILDQDQKDFAATCSSNVVSDSDGTQVWTGLRARNVNGQPSIYWHSGDPYQVNQGILLTDDVSGCYAISIDSPDTWTMTNDKCGDQKFFVCTRAPVTCESLLPPSNTQVSYIPETTPYYVDTVATYTCAEGYVLTGDSSTRTCLSDGMWSLEKPICAPVDCGPLAAPPQGTVAADTTTYNSVATYSCALGLVIVGAAPTRTCLADQTWSGTDLKCTVVDCGALSDPANGALTAQTTFFGSVATYSCNEDFKLDGAAERTCLATGFWVPESPTCVAEDSEILAIALSASFGGLTLLGIIVTLVVLCCRGDPFDHWHPMPYRRRTAPRPPRPVPRRISYQGPPGRYT